MLAWHDRCRYAHARHCVTLAQIAAHGQCGAVFGYAARTCPRRAGLVDGTKIHRVVAVRTLFCWVDLRLALARHGIADRAVAVVGYWLKKAVFGDAGAEPVLASRVDQAEVLAVGAKGTIGLGHGAAAFVGFVAAYVVAVSPRQAAVVGATTFTDAFDTGVVHRTKQAVLAGGSIAGVDYLALLGAFIAHGLVAIIGLDGAAVDAAWKRGSGAGGAASLACCLGAASGRGAQGAAGSDGGVGGVGVACGFVRRSTRRATLLG